MASADYIFRWCNLSSVDGRRKPRLALLVGRISSPSAVSLVHRR